jgi:hypothetical protein
MKHLVYAVPTLVRAGWHVTVLAERIQGCPDVEFIPLKLRFRNPVAGLFEFQVVVDQAARKLKMRRPNALIFGAAGIPNGADVSAIHFLHHLWLQEARKLKRKKLREQAALLLSRLHDWKTKRALNSDRSYYDYSMKHGQPNRPGGDLENSSSPMLDANLGITEQHSILS